MLWYISTSYESNILYPLLHAVADPEKSGEREPRIMKYKPPCLPPDRLLAWYMIQITKCVGYTKHRYLVGHIACQWYHHLLSTIFVPYTFCDLNNKRRGHEPSWPWRKLARAGCSWSWPSGGRPCRYRTGLRSWSLLVLVRNLKQNAKEHDQLDGLIPLELMTVSGG